MSAAWEGHSHRTESRGPSNALRRRSAGAQTPRHPSSRLGGKTYQSLVRSVLGHGQLRSHRGRLGQARSTGELTRTELARQVACTRKLPTSAGSPAELLVAPRGLRGFPESMERMDDASRGFSVPFVRSGNSNLLSYIVLWAPVGDRGSSLRSALVSDREILHSCFIRWRCPTWGMCRSHHTRARS